MSRPRLALAGPTLALCTALAGCSVIVDILVPINTLPPLRDSTMSVKQAGDTLVKGASTRGDVVAALGKATVVRFDSGYEVWAYRGKLLDPGSAGSELVLLFDASGILRKSRVRP